MENTDEKKLKRRRRIRLAALMVGLVIVTFLATALGFYLRYKEMFTIAEAIDIVKSSYYFYDEMEVDASVSALRGIASGLGDDYAAYYTDEEYQAMRQSTSGNYIGMGVTIAYGDGIFYINSVFENTPASEAGLLAGDVITEVNGVSAAEFADLNALLAVISSEEGDINELAVLRDGETLTFTVEMREVYSPYVYHEMLTSEIGYILITGFHGQCVTEVETAIEDLQSQGMTKLVLDVRNNLGGSLTAVNDIAEQFLPKNSVITTVRSRLNDEVVYRTDSEGISIPIAMLVNGNSASASELLAGALHDNGVARLFGTTTYGKGIVQSYFNLSGGNGYLKFTTDAYYTPNDVCIQGSGIEPDEYVEQDEKWNTTAVTLIPHEEDVQLQVALKYLEGLD